MNRWMAAALSGAVMVGCGDIVIIYSDGLVEHPGHAVGAGISHLEQVVAAWPPAALLDCEALAADVAPWPHPDDICLLVVRITAVKPPDSLLI